VGGPLDLRLPPHGNRLPGLSGNAADEQLPNLLTILRTTGTLLDRAGAISNDELRTSLQNQCETIFTVPLVEDSKALYYISRGGNLLKTGFSWLGGKMADGVNATGSWMNSKISPGQEPVEVSQESKEKMNKIKSTTKSTM